MKNKIKI